MTQPPQHHVAPPPEPPEMADTGANRGGHANATVDRSPDNRWNAQVRGENRTEQLDRNLASLLQELRVVQTGVQVLTGFLLTLPFQERFEEISAAMRLDYLFVAGASIAATACLTAPVAAHRILFRRHRLEDVVHGAHLCALTGILLLGCALTGVAVLIFDLVAGPLFAVAAGVGSALLFITLWIAHPYWQRAHSGRS